MFEQMATRGHENLSLIHHAPSGLRAVLAIHSSVLGPAIAPCRFMALDEESAVKDALALSETLTLKVALAGLNFGGGACILWQDDDTASYSIHAREALFRALGRQVGWFGGRLILTEDVGVTGKDLSYCAQETAHILGMHTDTPTITAYGVYRGIKAAARFYLGGESMRGVRVAILGVGTVGRILADYLLREGAKIIVADNRPGRAEEFAEAFDRNVTVVDVEALFDVPCDILAPCGFRGSIRRVDIPRLQARLIAGSEHNPIAPEDLPLIREAGLIYIPDFVVNAAGLIAAATGMSLEEAAERIYQNVVYLSSEAERLQCPPHEVARELALHRIDLIGSLGRSAMGSKA